MPLVTLTPVAMSDAQTLLEWVNRSDSLAASLQTSAPIRSEEHVDWLRTRIDDPDTRMWMVGSGTDLVGQLRFQDTGCGPEVAIYIDETFRGRGYALAALVKGLDTAAVVWPSGVAIARVKPGNETSVTLFEAAGFDLEQRRVDQLVYRRKL